MAFENAMEGGRLDVLKFLHKHYRMPSVVDIIVDVIQRGHYDVVQWLYDTALPDWDYSDIEHLALVRKEQLEKLQFLRQPRK